MSNVKSDRFVDVKVTGLITLRCCRISLIPINSFLICKQPANAGSIIETKARQSKTFTSSFCGRLSNWEDRENLEARSKDKNSDTKQTFS